MFSTRILPMLAGLSPLARGTRAWSQSSRFRCRFIPAGAGNTGAWASWQVTKSVYPRWRGEHVSHVESRHCCRGLSPLARGTRAGRGKAPRDGRFIPAGAGNTFQPWELICVPAVYPRWRGEHISKNCSYHAPTGLSPLARGTPLIGSLRWAAWRFIPAGAGNTP